MKKSILFLILILGVTSLSYEKIIDEEYSLTFERDVEITMRDGTVILGNVFRPTAPGRYPVIVSLGPYGKDRLPVKYKKRVAGDVRVSKYAALEVVDPAFWVSEGYVVVNADSRGSWRSQGNLSLFTDTETQDFYDLIEWVGSAQWSSGRVATSGISYYALTQWKVAEMNPPHLKAIIPWEGLTDIYRDGIFHGGMKEDSFFEKWYKRVRMAKRKGSTPGDLIGSVKKNPLYNDFYKKRTPDLSRINIPAFVVASWSNQGLHSRGAIEGFKGIASKDKWIYIHGNKKWEAYYSFNGQQEQKRFLDFYLKGIKNDMPRVPRVRYTVREAKDRERFLSDDTYPLKSTVRKKLYLDNTSDLLSESKVPVSSDDFISSQKSFNYAFTRDSDIVGGMTLMTYISSERSDDADIFVGIKKYDRDGNEVYFEGLSTSKGHVASGWLRVSQRKVDWSKIDSDRIYLAHDEVQKIKPGEIVQVFVEILPSGTSFKEGETLSLVISDRELKTAGKIKHTNINEGKNKIYTGSEYQSYLVVPLIR